MTRHIAQKIATAFVTIYVIITISFFLVHIMPGDPVIHLVGQEEYYYLLDNDPETLNKLIARYGLDDSLPVQYGKYLKNIVTLDFGTFLYEPETGGFQCSQSLKMDPSFVDSDLDHRRSSRGSFGSHCRMETGKAF